MSCSEFSHFLDLGGLCRSLDPRDTLLVKASVLKKQQRSSTIWDRGSESLQLRPLFGRLRCSCRSIQAEGPSLCRWECYELAHIIQRNGIHGFRLWIGHIIQGDLRSCEGASKGKGMTTTRLKRMGTPRKPGTAAGVGHCCSAIMKAQVIM